jgi:hypothetical protein
MSTGRKLVSDVRGLHKLLSTDSLITDRVILSELKKNTFLLVRRETNLRRLWATDTIFSTVPCLQMCAVPISSCCEYVENCEVARSKYKLPRIAEGIYQYIIQGVYSVNAMGGRGKKLKEVTINRYINLLKLPFVKKEEYFWIHDQYLYVSNPMIQAVRITAMFEEDIPMEIMYPDCDCAAQVSVEELCKNPLDKEFPLPGYLEKQVLDLTSQKLLGTYFGIKTDLANEGLDNQAPNINNQQK